MEGRKLRIKNEVNSIVQTRIDTWLKLAYSTISEELSPLLIISDEDIAEMEDYLEQSGDQLGKAIWLIAKSVHERSDYDPQEYPHE
jgi:hypothetical protein